MVRKGTLLLRRRSSQLADCVEKVENALAAKFAQKRADHRFRLVMPSQTTLEGRNESTKVEAVPHVPKSQAHQQLLENWSRRRGGLFQHDRPFSERSRHVCFCAASEGEADIKRRTISRFTP
jgi:hypothetical protein